MTAALDDALFPLLFALVIFLIGFGQHASRNNRTW